MTSNHKISASVIAIIGLIAIGLLLIWNTNQPTPAPDNQKLAAATSLAISGTSYYIDSINGLDTNSGTSTDTAWKTIGKANQAFATLKPGDGILLKRGGIWNEKLIVASSGTSGSPITIGTYGDGANPTIDLQNQTDFGILILNQAYITVQNIAITNAKSDTGPSAGIAIANSKNITVDSADIRDIKGVGGIFIYGSNPGLLSDITVRNSTITNTTGTTYSINGGNNGTGIQIWADCSTCGSNVLIENNTVTKSGAEGIGVFMPFVTVRGNTVGDTTYPLLGNGEAGIGAGGLTAHDIVIDSNHVANNCLKKDDCFGINMFRTGGNNIVKNNILTGQHNTITDGNVPINPGYPTKYGTGGIRFDGGDRTLGTGSDYMDQTGNSITTNQITNEYDGVQIFNYNNTSITGNTISNSARAAINAGADNTDGTNGTTKPITVTIQNNSITGKGIITTNATVLGDTPPDTTAPVISTISASSISQTGATIKWTTNENADTQVEYGKSTTYESVTTINPTLTTSHNQTLTGLIKRTTYHYRVKSKDTAGNLAVSADKTFTTSR